MFLMRGTGVVSKEGKALTRRKWVVGPMVKLIEDSRRQGLETSLHPTRERERDHQEVERAGRSLQRTERALDGS